MKSPSNPNYSQSFYESISHGAADSSSEIVPFLIDLLKPNSVVDVGCGSGLWLKAFETGGVQHVRGFDGPWIHKNALVIDESRFTVTDLSNPEFSGERFDLCISLEVAEHLPEESAEKFVHFLTNLSGMVVFSAAIPRQGGTNHLNEQWQSYWIDKFSALGYTAFDVIRPKFWDNTGVAVHYKQNAFLFSNIDDVNKNLKNSDLRMPNAIHPDHYLPVTDPTNYSLRKFFGCFLPHLVKQRLRTK